MGLYRYRIYDSAQSLTKALAVVDSKTEVDRLIAVGERRIVKRFQGRTMLKAYNVERFTDGHVRWSGMNTK